MRRFTPEELRFQYLDAIRRTRVVTLATATEGVSKDTAAEKVIVMARMYEQYVLAGLGLDSLGESAGSPTEETETVSRDRVNSLLREAKTVNVLTFETFKELGRSELGGSPWALSEEQFVRFEKKVKDLIAAAQAA